MGAWARRTLALFLCAWFTLAWADAPAPGLIGQVDAVQYSPGAPSVEVLGWAFDNEHHRPPAGFDVRLGNIPLTSVQWMLTPRRDVAQAFAGVDAWRAGFELKFDLPANLPAGVHPLAVTARFDDHSALGLPMHAKGGASIDTRTQIPKRHWQTAAVVLAAIVLLSLARTRRGLDALGGWVARHQRRVALGIVGWFLVLVALGWTGSSLQLLLGKAGDGGNAFLSADSGMGKLVQSPRGIRSDEWGVVSASALAQANHVPPWPIVNRNLGVDGQNMLVVAMTGVPVWHVSALARPATWGFFALPLQQALGWYWYFPFFACLLVLWGLLNRFMPSTPGRNLALSWLFCIAPYAAGWSNWPLYAVFFPSAAVLTTIAMLHSASRRSVWLLGVLLGCLLAGFALVLYPPWQIPLATFFALVLVGYVADQRAQLAMPPRAAVALGLALVLATLIAALLMAGWWLDARDAVAAMRATVYPGERAALQGADVPLGWFLRGYTNVETMTHLRFSEFNESEFGSYFFLFMPLAYLALRQMLAQRRHRYLLAAWVAFVAFALIFRVWGVPLALSKALGWHYVTSHRIDLALGLASTVLMAVLLQGTQRPMRWHKAEAVALALVSAGVVLLGLWGVPHNFAPTFTPVLVGTMVAAGFFMAYWLMQGRITSAIALNALVYLIATLAFNPVARAPQHVGLQPEVQSLLQQAPPVQGLDRPRVLVVFPQVSSMHSMRLAAAGVAVSNGVFYYPQPTLWRQLPHHDARVVNRYQHLLFSLGNVDEPAAYRVHSPSLDTVRVTLDAQRFDFNATGASVITALEPDALALAHNPTLSLLGSFQGWSWFAVKPHG